MKRIVLISAIFLLSVVAIIGQSTPTPTATPMPSPTATASSVLKPEVTPTSEPTPDPNVEPSDKGWSVSGGIDIVSRYHGSNGQRFGGADQNIYGEVQYRFNPKFAMYCGGWYALQFKELDVNCGARVATGKVDHDLQVQLLYLFDGNIPVYNFNYDISTKIVKTNRFSASLFGRYEYYGTRRKDNIQAGSYLIGGVRTDTELGKGWNFGFSPRVLYDVDGVFGAESGTVFLATGELTRKVGRFTVGPGFKFSTNMSTSDRPTLFTLNFSLSF